MSTKILIAPDSFKECIDSVLLASIIKKQLEDVDDVELIVKPISDGGDGFLKVCKYYFHLEELSYTISTPYDSGKMNCVVGYDRNEKSIYIESADVLGLKLIPEEKRKPLSLSSKGLGELLDQIKSDVESDKLMCDKIYLGIGGTGTVDLGFGMCSVFGLQLFDFFGKQLDVLPENYFRTGDIAIAEYEFPFQIIPIVDVDNPLLGEEGAVKKFAIQKGATNSDIKLLELGFNKVINLLIKKNILPNLSNLNGAGGGIASALQIFFNCKPMQAKSFILNTLRVEEEIKSSKIIITGEGKLDSQSSMGKGAFSIAEHSSSLGKKAYFICGSLENGYDKLKKCDYEVIELSKFFRSSDASIQNIRQGIALACDRIKSKI